MMKKTALFIFLLFAFSASAETTGTINFTYNNATTGLSGYTVKACNTDADCAGYKCFRDYDSVSNGTGSAGWCNMSAGSTDGCFFSPDASNIYAVINGGTVCDFNTTANNTYRTCLNGNWSLLNSCSGSQVCVPDDQAGSCTTPTAGSGSGSGSQGGLGAGNFTSTVNAALSITSVPSEFEIFQGASVSKTIVVKNVGNKTLNNVTLSLTGINWYSINPTKISQMIKDAEGSFSVTFNPSSDTSPSSYTVTATAAAAEIISPSKTFIVRINLSEQNAQQTLLPDLDNYTTQLDAIEDDIEKLEGRGANVSDVKDLFLSARGKLIDAKILAEAKDYTTAAKLVGEAKSLMDQANAKLAELDEQTKFKLDPMLIVYAVVVLVVIGFLRYLLLPPKNEKRKSLYELLADQENTFVEKIKRRFNNENKNRKK